MKTHNPYFEQILKIQKVKSTFKRDLIGLLWGAFLKQNTENKYDFEIALPTLEHLIKFVDNNVTFNDTDETLKKLPVGKYAEQLLAAFFNQSEKFHLLANNLQLIAQKRTIGEVDFLLENCETKVYIHLEFAIKFYLKTTEDGEIKYLGPKAKDSLKGKLKKLHEQQLQLFPKHNQLLPEKLQNLSFQPKLLMKVYFFFPFEEWQSKNQNIATEGWWIKVQDWEKLVDDASYFQFIEDKRQWIFPYSNQNETYNATESKKILEQLFTDGGNHSMLIRLDKNKTIIDRGFVVGNQWPRIQTVANLPSYSL